MNESNDRGVVPEPRIVTPQEAQDRLTASTPGTWSSVQEGWTPSDHNYSVASMTDQGYVTVAPAGGADLGISADDAALIEIAPDLAHTVATEPDRIRAAVVKALRDAATSVPTEHAEYITKRADAIENGADW